MRESGHQRTVVTIDAGCGYAEITETVKQVGADYIITLKENQPMVYAKVESPFNESAKQNNEGVPCYRETNKGHGREEERTYYAISVQKDQLPEKWSGVAASGIRNIETGQGKKDNSNTIFQLQ